MIRTTINARATGIIRLLVLSLAILIIQGCTNSKFVISPLYNRLDDQIRKEFNKLGDFTEAQTASFEASLGTFHVWHRQSELPEYALLMRTIAQSVAKADTRAADVQTWFDSAELYFRKVRECHPINFSFELMKSMPDEQFSFIERRFKGQQLKNLKRYESRTPKERADQRVKNIVKWANRLNLKITPTQRAMLLSTFKRQVSLRREYYKLSGEWNRKFFTLARNQADPAYDRRMRTHLNRLWTLLEDAHPAHWKTNRELWKETVLRLVTSMTDDQRKTLSPWLNKMASTLESIAKDKPSFKVVDDPSIGCLVDPEKN